jgi:hypothetical protein
MKVLDFQGSSRMTNSRTFCTTLIPCAIRALLNAAPTQL